MPMLTHNAQSGRMEVVLISRRNDIWSESTQQYYSITVIVYACVTREDHALMSVISTYVLMLVNVYYRVNHLFD